MFACPSYSWVHAKHVLAPPYRVGHSPGEASSRQHGVGGPAECVWRVAGEWQWNGEDGVPL